MRCKLVLLLMFFLLVPSFSWWNHDWQYRRQIVVDGNSITEKTYNYPMIIDTGDGLNRLVSYHFDESNLTQIKDFSGNQHTLTLYNAELSDSFFVNSRSIYFKGTTSSFANTSFDLNLNVFSTAFWIKTNDTDGGIVSISNALQPNEFTVLNPSNLTIYIGGLSANTSVNVSDNNWHFVVVAWNSSDGNLSVYIDGNLTYSTTFQAGHVVDSDILTLGKDTGTGQALNGFLDEFIIFNKFLTSEEIKKLYHGAFGGKALWNYRDIVFVWYNASSGQEQLIPQRIDSDGVFWIRVPELSPAYTTSVFMYYGNPNNTVNFNNDSAFISPLFVTGKISVSSFNWTTVNFTEPFDTVPLVFATVEFTGDYPNTEVARVRHISRYGFQVRAEPYDGYSAPTPLRIYWVAVPNYYTIKLDNIELSTYVLEVQGYPPQAFHNIPFVNDGINLHQIQTYNEIEEGSHSRIAVPKTKHVDALIEECIPQSDHVFEDIALLNIPEGVSWINDGVIYTARSSTLDNVTFSLPLTISNIGSVIAKVESINDEDPVDVHVENVNSTSVFANMDETPCCDGTHIAAEDIILLVTNITFYKGLIYPNPVNYLIGAEETPATEKPSIVQIYFSPAEPISTDDITCFVSISGYADIINYKWYVNGSLVANYNTTETVSTLASSYTTKNQVVVCEASVFIGGLLTDTKNVSTTVRNSPPSVPTYLTPISGIYGGEKNIVPISCGGSTDVDSDTIEYRIFALFGGSWSFIGSSTSGNVEWNVSGLQSQINVDIYCKACDDESCSLSYNPAGTLTIDNDAPVTSTTIDTEKWYNHSVTVELYCSDNVDCARTYYCVDQTNSCYPTIIYSSPINMTSEGIYYLRAYSQDEVNNTESVKSFTIKLDFTPPNITVFQPNKTEYQGSFLINISVIDNFLVGYCSYEYGGFEGIIPDCKNITVCAPLGNYTLRIYAFDPAGNYRLVELPVVLRPITLRAGGGGGIISLITLYIKVPFSPRVDAYLCIDKSCKYIDPNKGIEKFQLSVSEYAKAKVKIVYRWRTVWINLKDKYGIKNSVLVDVGRELGLKRALYRQEIKQDKLPDPRIMMVVGLVLFLTAGTKKKLL